MNLQWLFPLGLAGLAAVLVPLLVHLARRREHRRIVFAALRWLPAGRAPRRSLRIEEPWLLALRMLLLAVAALWLAQPVLRGGLGGAQRWLAVSPDVDAAHARGEAIGFDRAVWLAPGFPELGGPPPAQPGALASLLRELDARLPHADQVQVLVPAVVDGLDARALKTGRAFSWRQVPDAQARPMPADDAAPLLVLRHQQAPAPRWLHAAVAAWSADGALRVRVDEGGADTAIPAETEAIVWIGDSPSAAVRAQVRGGARLLQLGADAPADEDADEDVAADAERGTLAGIAGLPVLRERHGRGEWLRLQGTPDPARHPQLLDASFPRLLHTALFAPDAQPARASAGLLIDSSGSTGMVATVPGGLRDRALGTPLAVLLALLFALERLLATGRRLRRAR